MNVIILNDKISKYICYKALRQLNKVTNIQAYVLTCKSSKRKKVKKQ